MGDIFLIYLETLGITTFLEYENIGSKKRIGRMAIDKLHFLEKYWYR